MSKMQSTMSKHFKKQILEVMRGERVEISDEELKSMQVDKEYREYAHKAMMDLEKSMLTVYYKGGI